MIFLLKTLTPKRFVFLGGGTKVSVFFLLLDLKGSIHRKGWGKRNVFFLKRRNSVEKLGTHSLHGTTEWEGKTKAKNIVRRNPVKLGNGAAAEWNK